MRFLPADPRHHLRVHRFIGRMVGLTAAATGLLVVTGCHMLGTSSSAAPTASATLTVSAVPGVADAPLYIGIRDGLFKAAGLTIRLHPFSNAKTAIDHLRNGSTDIAFADYADAFYANELKPSPNLAIVADGYDCGPNVIQVLTLPNSPITSPQDLAGKRIGTPEPQGIPANKSQPYSQETVATWSALTSDNVPPAGITWDPMPAVNLASALKTGQVDAILATEPTTTKAETQYGMVPVLDSCSGATADMPLDGYFTTHGFAKQHSAALAAFRSALAKAQADAGISAPVQTALEHYAGMDMQTASLVTTGVYPTTLSPSNIQRCANLMFFYNALPAPASAQGMVAP